MGDGFTGQKTQPNIVKVLKEIINWRPIANYVYSNAYMRVRVRDISEIILGKY